MYGVEFRKYKLTPFLHRQFIPSRGDLGPEVPPLGTTFYMIFLEIEDNGIESFTTVNLFTWNM